jgi:hypothetical protein
MASEGRDPDEVRRMWDALLDAGGVLKKDRLEEALRLFDAIR